MISHCGIFGKKVTPKHDCAFLEALSCSFVFLEDREGKSGPVSMLSTSVLYSLHDSASPRFLNI